MARERVLVTTQAWGTASLTALDLAMLSEATGLTAGECIERFRNHRLEETAAEWRRRDPKTPDEIRQFYANGDFYLWELLGWNGSSAYEPYLRRLERVAELWPPDRYPRVLDYGAGVGTAALRLAQMGYHVTMADVPGVTIDFGTARVRRHGYPVDVIQILGDVPALPRHGWDVIVSFDVLEHLVNPAAVGHALVNALVPGGGATILASFDTDDERFPHHLAAGRDHFRGHRWELYLEGLGMKSLGDFVYRKATWPVVLGRRARYALWRATGMYIHRIER